MAVTTNPALTGVGSSATGGAVSLTDGTTTAGVDAASTGLKVAIAADLTPAPTSPLLVQVTDNTNGTDTMPTGDAIGRAIYVRTPTDGTHTTPTADVAARAGFQQITDLTNVAAVKAASTAAAAADPALVVSASPNSVQTVGGTTPSISVEITRPADTTAYTANDAVNTSTSSPTFITFANAVRTASGTAYITKARLVTNQLGCTAQFRLWLFSANTATLTNDNTALAIMYADAAIRLGYIDFPALAAEGGGTDCATAQVIDIRMKIAGDASKAVYGLLETKTGFTPASGQKFTVILTPDQN